MKKTIPNAMVQIPTNLHGVTIKPTTSKCAGAPKHVKILPKIQDVTVTKVSKLVNPLSKVNKLNGKTILKPIAPRVLNIPDLKLNSNVPLNTQGINPINLFKKINSQVAIHKVPSKKVSQPLIRINSPNSINNLPHITVKRGLSGIRPNFPIKPVKSMRHVVQMKYLNMQNANKKNIRSNVKVTNEVLTVDLDDDDTDASTSSPQWYMRPEDENKPSQQEENSKEPDQTKFVEITIEDSPVKTKPVKKVEDLAVTIEDSPVKVLVETTANKSDGEDGAKTCKTPQSKKKLAYPKEPDENKVIEIEIEPMVANIEAAIDEVSQAKTSQVSTSQANTSQAIASQANTSQAKSKETEVLISPNIIVEIEESPLKEADMQLTSTPKKNQNRPPVKFPEVEICEKSTDNCEFHPVYENFIKTCFVLENSEDMHKIVEKKVKMYYRQVPKYYTESEQFIDMVSSKIIAMKASPDKMYLFIKDIVDELNLQRKMAKTQPVKSDKEKVAAEDAENFLYGENSEFDSKRQRQIRKLEKTLKKLHRAIQKLEEQEVDFDDEEDSVYLLTERYKERMMRVHAKFCQLTNTKMPSEPKVHLDPRPGHPVGPAKKLEKWINKKVPIGTPLPFPDFHDVLRCVKEANEEDKLGWNDVDIMEEARDLFIRCGKKLQRRRQENEWRTAASRISLDEDPADKNEELKKKLVLNKQLAAKKELEVFNKFAEKQSQLKLEAEEIGDKEAEESPVESEEEEETIDEESLENKDKRKERLKRLLQEKSHKKSTDEKENEPTETSINILTDEDIKEPTTTKDDEMKSVEDKNDKEIQDDKIEGNTPDVVKNITDEPNTNDEEANNVESDVDELHLLQKLYSENDVNTSTVDSSDSEAPISISDTLDSKSSDEKSVISIENSSYSETEINKNDSFEMELEKEPRESKDISVSIPSAEVIKEAIDTNIEIECSESGIQKKHVQSNNDEYNESVEDILLASSDDESVGYDHQENIRNKDNVGDGTENVEKNEIGKNFGSIENTVNLKDDNLSIGETVVGDENLEQNMLDSPLGEVSDKSTSLNKNKDIVNEALEDVLTLDADSPMQADGIVDEKNCDDRNTNKVISTDNDDGHTVKIISAIDNLTSYEEVNHDCVSLDDDSSAGEIARDYIDKGESNSLSQDLDTLSDNPKVEENNHVEEVSTVSEMSCDDNVNDPISETIVESMVVEDDLDSNLYIDSSKADGTSKDSKLTEGTISTVKTTM
ncbi:titin homolog isoform X2 [Plodia interpunctella]|uniref:titin homolog isoform X2 n=1 Tax=Plodia interpunctella TaxID=58824 RepID=UPI002368455C|nr:titin homolog isoform X2 [Plodia interpunctella]